MRRLLLFFAIGLERAAAASASLTVDLSEQMAYLFAEGLLVASAPISSGRASHPTPTGTFEVLEKELNHFSTLYGRIVGSSGRVLRHDATGFTPLPSGARFVPSPMRYYIEFDRGHGLHAGLLPGYPASHGCIRLPRDKARPFFEKLQVGDTIHIYGRAPERKQSPIAEPTPVLAGQRRSLQATPR
jgi:L,D-transpeptidase catalytic domain